MLGDEFIATPIDGMGEIRRRFITTLEEIQPGNLPTPDYGQPGSASNQDLLLRAYRLSMLHGSAPFLSLQRSSVIPVNYQLVPLVMALEQPRVRLLIADDVGLGKTIEAGLILAEPLARGRAKRFLIITPANLREQWQQALSYFFHLDTRILSGKTRREYEKELPAGANPWQFFQRIIVSIDYAKQTEQKFKILEQPWDLVLVDEAHQAAKPHQSSSQQQVDMDRWNLIKELSLKTFHLLLLTATPHNGYTDSFASLIQMLDNSLVSGPPNDLVVRKAFAKKYVCQRSRRDVEKWFVSHEQESPFPERDHLERPIPIHRDYDYLLKQLHVYSNKLLSEARSLKRRYTLTQWVVFHFQKRALSSPAALRESLENRLKEVRRRIQKSEEFTQSEDVKEIIKKTVFDEDTGEKVDPEEATRRTDRAMINDTLDLKIQEKMLLEIIEGAKKITPKKDNKLQYLITHTLPGLFKNDSKVIIFTRYKDTLDYLLDRLEKSFNGIKILSLFGDMSEAARREEFLKFEKAEKAILVATDVISEGLNLQHACSQIVHYELPWNPNRLEQRNGRVDRFGQPKKKVYIRTLVMDQTLDVAVLEHLIKKAYRIRQDRGFCPPFFGDEVNVALLIRAHKPVSDQLTLFEEIAGPLEEAMAERLFNPLDDEVVDRVESDSFYGEIDISLPDIDKRLQTTQQLIGSPDQIQNFVRSALNRYGCQLETESDGSITIRINDRRLQLPGIGEKLNKATFDPRQALADPELIVLDLGHPLVKRLIDIVREDFFRTGEFFGRIMAKAVPTANQVTVVYHYLVRFSVNTDPVIVLEELVPVAFPVYGDSPINANMLEQLQKTTPLARIPNPAEVKAHLEEAERNSVYNSALETAIQLRKEELIKERHELKEKLMREGDESILEWLEGIDSLETASHDLLTITLYLPK